MLQRSDENQQIAAQLREASDLLQAQGANSRHRDARPACGQARRARARSREVR